MYFFLGDFEKAAARYSKAVDLMPHDQRLWGNLADSYFYTDALRDEARVAYGRAIEICEQELAINPNDTGTMSNLAYYYSRVGQIDKSRALNRGALAAAPGNMYVHYYSALIHAHLGETADALLALERAVELEYQADLLLIDPGLSGLVDEERFKTLISRNIQ